MNTPHENQRDPPAEIAIGVERPELSSATNESTFRRINEAIEEGRVTADGPMGLLCECGRAGCGAVLELTVDAYEAVRVDGRQFLVTPGHEAPDDEIAERHDAHVVTRKRGPAAASAQRTNPRRERPVADLLWGAGTHVPLVRVDVEARPESVGEVRRWLIGFATEHGADPDQLSRIGLAVSEAITNAVVHAYPPGSPGQVHVVMDLEDEELEVVVADDGQGLRASLDSYGLGAGLPIVAACSDRFAIRERVPHGIEVWMRFSLRR